MLLLVQTQLSSYDTKGIFSLETDSGWQMSMGRIREMLSRDPELRVDITCPLACQLKTQPQALNADMFEEYGDRLHVVHLNIVPNALVTRYDFNYREIKRVLERRPKYDAIYINDPMLLRSYKALFHAGLRYTPKFYVHSHFVDVPSSPKFPTETSLWMGQIEAAVKADHNFWQCSSALEQFAEEAREVISEELLSSVLEKSEPWDDGYSINEITSQVNVENIRFDTAEFDKIVSGKTVIFVPNRIGGMGRSSDYTNCGKFMFEMLPKLRAMRDDFVVIAGNPNQKFSNDELTEMCGENGYVQLTPDAFNRDEFKYVARRADIAVGLYTEDTYGGTVARECIELGCLPMWCNKYEYAKIAKEAGNYPFLCAADLSDAVFMLDAIVHNVRTNVEYMANWHSRLRRHVRARCAYENTTPKAMLAMGM